MQAIERMGYILADKGKTKRAIPYDIGIVIAFAAGVLLAVLAQMVDALIK